MLTVQDVFVAGVRSAVHDSAPGTSSDAVVFVHGNPGPMDDWEWLVPELSQFARCVAVDLPGFGRAEHPHDFDFSVAGYTRHLAGILDQLNVQRAHLVLHDFGGAFGLTWATAHAERCASITLINTGVLAGYRWHTLAKIWQTPLFGELFQWTTTAKLMKLTLDRDNPRPMPQAFVDRVMRYADWPHRRAVLKLYRATRDTDRAFTFPPAQLARLDVPVCVVWGKGDPYLPVAFAPRQLEAFPRAEVHELAGLGHWPFIDDPEAVRAILLPFLRRAVAEPQGRAADAGDTLPSETVEQSAHAALAPSSASTNSEERAGTERAPAAIPALITRTLFLLFLALVLAPAWPSASEPPQGTWKQVDDDHGIKVWRLEIPGRELPGFRGETIIPASAERIVEVLKQVEQHTQWMHRCTASDVIERISDDRVVIYNRTDAPWPVWDRDAILDTSFTYSADGKLITLAFKSTDPQRRAVPEKVVRMPRLEGSYRMWKLAGDRTKVVYQVEVDIGGSVPTFVAEHVARDMPYETLSRLRARVSSAGAHADAR